MITTKKINENVYEAYYDNGKHAGNFERMDDGFFGFWPEEDTWGAAYTQDCLQALYIELSKLNQESWNKHVKKGTLHIHPDDHPLDVWDGGSKYNAKKEDL